MPRFVTAPDAREFCALIQKLAFKYHNNCTAELANAKKFRGTTLNQIDCEMPRIVYFLRSFAAPTALETSAV